MERLMHASTLLAKGATGTRSIVSAAIMSIALGVP